MPQTAERAEEAGAEGGRGGGGGEKEKGESHTWLASAPILDWRQTCKGENFVRPKLINKKHLLKFKENMKH